ncbi:ATP-binding protein [Acidobacteria bacterium AH-259-L09]|nr:ATP-binding protein [Acidobacteria bacterium AH-259-L09]
MIPREVQALFDKLQPIHGSKLEVLRIEYQLNPSARPEIEFLLSDLAAKHLGEHQLTPSPKQAVRGKYALGQVIVGARPWDTFGLHENEWIQHVGVFGRSGGGKTNVEFLILKEFAAQGKPFLVFDWKRN